MSIHRKFEQEQWRRTRPPNQRQLDNLRMNGAGHGKPGHGKFRFFLLQSKKLGRPISDIEAWVHTHRGSNPEDITSLNTEEATTCLVSAR